VKEQIAFLGRVEMLPAGFKSRYATLWCAVWIGTHCCLLTLDCRSLTVNSNVCDRCGKGAVVHRNFAKPVVYAKRGSRLKRREPGAKPGTPFNQTVYSPDCAVHGHSSDHLQRALDKLSEPEYLHAPLTSAGYRYPRQNAAL